MIVDPDLIAKKILDGFNRHYSVFREQSQEAKFEFEKGNYRGIRALSSERITFYDKRIKETSALLEKSYGESLRKDSLWPEVKKSFIMLLTDHKQPELAESFFNSITTQLLDRAYFKNEYLFVRPAVSTDYLGSQTPSYRVYYPLNIGIKKTLVKITLDFELNCPWENVYLDVRALLKRIFKTFEKPFRITPDLQIHILKSLFYRNKAAYIIGRIILDGDPVGFTVPILRNISGHFFLDTIITDKEQIRLLFSFSRAYFMVDMEVPSAYVSFLKTLMPFKPSSELYTMLGLQKQGKTLFYRDLLHHLKNSNDRFRIADGIKGLVMLVFTLPSFPYVFKIIKDERKKDVSRDHIENRYQLVKLHDRVGRMADTLEYSFVDFPLDRIQKNLLDELLKVAPSMCEIINERLIIKHVYIERRMMPLNIFLENASDSQIEKAIKEYGDAIRQLIAANIFPGDLLYKNFGLTKHGRVVFYDYDEIQYITDCNFRRLPPPRTPEDELSEEPWYKVGPNDVFPEEFETFLLTQHRINRAFKKYHAELLSPEFWTNQQKRIEEGFFDDVFPYPNEQRFFPDKNIE
ncbi:MAG: bifunctional isocitrate dehydrogenase kinase/phosphatase [Betaproteobacteria bacterium TMED41]|nr:MAG: bifunctional isocitrate dehydrogenase kinase/phosphatase [Betaproteobacteria bacterium TMED41]|tara:strand:+ start:3826 stop:5553 length:1728 start_codon:yes stop_codon:yes gene_type:complete